MEDENREMGSIQLINLEMQRLHCYVAPSYTPSTYGGGTTSKNACAEIEWAKKQLEIFHEAILVLFKAQAVGPGFVWTVRTEDRPATES